jgi:transcriptional regulator with XRE-family HTH domain
VNALDAARRGLLRALMAGHRGNVDRLLVGLSTDKKRLGISQEELARLVHVTEKTITRLENGQLRNTESLLGPVASVLNMRPWERHFLWLLTQDSPDPPGSFAQEPHAGLTRLIETVYPQPALVTDAAFRVLAVNAGVTAWLVDFDTTPVEDRNFATWLLTDPHARHVFVDWEDMARRMLARLRAAAARFPNSTYIGELIMKLRERDKELDAMWLAEGGVFYEASCEVRLLRRPGHTDPEQPDDADHHVVVELNMLGPQGPTDGRRAIVVFLPDEEPASVVRSQEVCVACPR